MLELRRIGWEATDPFVLVTDLEGKVKLAETPPKMLAKMLKDAVQRMHERHLAAKLNWGGRRPAGKGLLGPREGAPVQEIHD